MNISPRKHSAPYQPVNTLSSAQKPCFKPPKHNPQNEAASDGSFYVKGHPINAIGDSSSLFEESHLVDSPQLQKPRKESNKSVKGIQPTLDMVRERDASARPPPRNEPPAPAPASAPHPLQESKIAGPQFGEASLPSNPLKQIRAGDEYSHLFNKPKPGQRRPEHFQTGPRVPPQHLPPLTDHQHDPELIEIPASQFQARPSQALPVSRPQNPPVQTTYPPPRPMYSSMGQDNGFRPVNKGLHNPLQPARQTIILENEDNFDPDAAIRAEDDRFGAPDVHAYVDSGQASENIKALLEGAFDDDENIPRLRLRKKKKKQEETAATNTLADRLQALAVKDEAPGKDTEEEEEEEEEDDGTIDGLKVKLLPHQRDGVAWMIEKETGNHNKRAKLPKGGILADDMGLGKTVQSLALILSNPRPEKGVEPENKKNRISNETCKTTLVVAPLALIKQWEAEFNSKIMRSHALKVLVHHGPNRTKSPEKLKQYDLVVTTYQILASEHADSGVGPDGLKRGCFGVHWYRIMLDEAHTIKNRNAKMTKACYELRSHYRWCLTGTPMQNNLDELQSLIKFLRIQPYCELSSWKDSISGPMKNGRGNLAMRRLQVFLKAFMKRRTKDVLKKEGGLNFGGKAKDGEDKPVFQIVARNVETVVGEFTTQERAFYDRLSNRAQHRLDEMLRGEKQDYIGALVLLLRLRQACNHPDLTKSNVKDDKDALTTESKSNARNAPQTPRKAARDDADDLADLLGGLSVQTKRCDLCQNALTSDNSVANAIRCIECENDLSLSTKKSKKSKKNKKKHRKHKHKDGKVKKLVLVESSDEEAEAKVESRASKAPRQRRVIVDSEDEDEAEGEWLVPEEQQHFEDRGKVGGTDDENAEGGGDTLASIDSKASGSEDESRSNLDSFVVQDTDTEDEAHVHKKLLKKARPQVTTLDSDSDGEDASASESDSDDSGSEDADSDDDSETEESEPEYRVSNLTPSTKIRQLLRILEKETPEHKVIVFSQFTSMLDLIEPFLTRDGYNFTRYDGKMRNDLREASLQRLRENKRTRVLLCSLKCGSLGLNLTAASRVVIMEPFWNPFVEEQAIDRVHRLNQTVDVTVYRLSIYNTVEERILELQEAKRALANTAIEGGKAIGKLGMKEILALFQREAEYQPGGVDDPDELMFGLRRVLEPTDNGTETTAPRPARRAGSLGFRKEDSVYGRR